ncbi:MAG: AbfB domain-containing protein [Oscillospiraceae bacterium]|nr:AbfB domain-containing protein [Oscillospiraceae bacterium]
MNHINPPVLPFIIIREHDISPDFIINGLFFYRNHKFSHSYDILCHNRVRLIYERIQQNDLKRATFRTVTGLSDRRQVSFESVSSPGQYLTAGTNGALTLTDGRDAAACTFRIDEKS